MTNTDNLQTMTLSFFRRTTVRQFNKYYCDGNPIALPSDAPLYFKHIEGVGMVTVCKCDGQWICEVTDGDSTGIAQSGYHDSADGAWNDTKNQLLKGRAARGKRVYEIEFTVTLSTCRCIEAESKKQALEYADELLNNDRFYEDLIEAWDGPFSGWDEPNEPKVLACYEGEHARPDYDVEDLMELYGVEV